MAQITIDRGRAQVGRTARTVNSATFSAVRGDTTIHSAGTLSRDDVYVSCPNAWMRQLPTTSGYSGYLLCMCTSLCGFLCVTHTPSPAQASP